MLFNFKRTILISLVLIISLLMIAATPLQAPSVDITIYVQMAIAAFTALVGWPALLSTLVLATQYFGWLTASMAETLMLWVNVVLFVGIFILAILGKIDLVNQIDSTFGAVAQLITYILILLGVPLAFERARATEEKIRTARFFQARIMSRAK